MRYLIGLKLISHYTHKSPDPLAGVCTGIKYRDVRGREPVLTTTMFL